MKIGLAGEYYSKNLGDPLLFACTEYLCRKYMSDDIDFSYIDIFGRIDKNDISCWKEKGDPFIFCLKAIRKIYKCLTKKTALYVDEKIWEYGKQRKRLNEYFYKRLKGLDAIIVMGAGTIKYDVRLNFAPYYKELFKAASEYNIPVFINCAGVESKYNPADRRCRMFSDILSMDILKIATTRDDIDTLDLMIHNSNTETAKIADIGVWSAEAFGIRKKKSNVIGLGIITPERFVEFKRDITPEQYEKTYIEIIASLEKQGQNWKLFNNGDDCDRIYAEQLCRKAGFDPSDKLETPKCPRELVEIISGFKGIITSRLHSCIVAYSLNVPFTAIIWNNKLKYFADDIGYSQRIIDGDGLSCDNVLKKINEAITQGYDVENRNRYKKTNIEYIEKYYHYICDTKEGKEK